MSVCIFFSFWLNKGLFDHGLGYHPQKQDMLCPTCWLWGPPGRRKWGHGRCSYLRGLVDDGWHACIYVRAIRRFRESESACAWKKNRTTIREHNPTVSAVLIVCFVQLHNSNFTMLPFLLFNCLSKSRSNGPGHDSVKTLHFFNWRNQFRFQKLAGAGKWISESQYSKLHACTSMLNLYETKPVQRPRHAMIQKKLWIWMTRTP